MESKKMSKSEGNSGGGLSMHLLWSRYIIYWPLFLIFLTFAITGAWLYLRYTTPLYQTSARILIKDEKKGAEDSKAMEALNLLSTKRIIENEIEVIKSRALVNDVVKNLFLYAPVFGEGKIKPFSAYVISPIKIEVNNLDFFKEAEKVYFTFNSKDSSVSIGDNNYPVNQWVSTPYGSLRFALNNASEYSNKNRLYFSLIDPKKIATDVLGRLSVSSVSKLSTIINLELKDEVPLRGEDILNELLAAYNRAVIQDKNALASNTLSFVEERLGYVKRDLTSIEQRAQNYRSRRGAIDIGTQGRLFLENVSSNDQKLSEINMQLAVLNQVEQYVRSKDNKGGIVPSTLGVNDPGLSQLLNKLYEEELQYEKLKSTTAENYPSLLSVSSQIEKIKPSIIENINSLRNGLQASKSNLISTNNMYSSALQAIPQTEKELIDINREQNIKNEIYEFLLKKKEETALSHAAMVADNRIVDKAQSSLFPVSPKGKIIYMAATAMALILCIGSVVTREMLSGKILFRDEIEKLTSFPIIGEIAKDGSKEQVVVKEGERTFVAEQFRQLRTALGFLKTKNSTKKRILVTSTIAGEGKSFIATNLALSLASAGKKVILLELDLNRPALSNSINILNEQGISDYLLGYKEPEELIKRVSINENLFFIPSGPVPKNPAELLANGKIQNLLNYLDAIFDYIVIDTAPVGPVTDAYILSPICDLTLYIIRHKYTPKIFVQRLDENNRIKKLKNLAIVFNGILPRGFGKTSYGYGYGYGYVYKSTDYYHSNS